MNWQERFGAEAPTIAPLAEKVRKLTRHLAYLTERQDDEAAGAERLVRHLDDLRKIGTESLGDRDKDAFAKFRTSWKRSQGRLELQREAVSLLAGELIPGCKSALAAARAALGKALSAMYGRLRADCEAAMTEAIAAAVGVHDSFIEAGLAFFKEHGSGLDTGNHLSGTNRPTVKHPRLDAVRRHATGLPWLVFTAPEKAAVPVPKSAPKPAVPRPGAGPTIVDKATLLSPEPDAGPVLPVEAAEAAQDGPGDRISAPVDAPAVLETDVGGPEPADSPETDRVGSPQADDLDTGRPVVRPKRLLTGDTA